MIELRWVVPESTTTQPATLQWRYMEQNPWTIWAKWGAWRDVPTVIIPVMPNTAHEPTADNKQGD